jgi:FdrA protein
MPSIKSEIRSGVYYDSVVLMQLQRSLVDLPKVQDAGVVMGTKANLALLDQTGLLIKEITEAKADDLVIVVKAESEKAALDAIGKVDELVAARRSRDTAGDDFLPKSLESAAKMLPDAQWSLISVPGRYAAGVSREALRLGKHVFLYSDNVSLEEEIELKREGAKQGLLVMGPDCGTAIINGIGLGFANKIQKGSIGMVAASGTGLQQVSVRIHQLGGGITHAIGTGGRDLSSEIGGITTRMGLEVLNRDPETKVIILVSKPPDKEVADLILKNAQTLSKPVIVNFIGYASNLRQVGNLHFTTTFDETAATAVNIMDGVDLQEADLPLKKFKKGQRYLRGLYSGGTLAYEALLILDYYLTDLYSNVPINKDFKLENSLVSQKHTVVDLGEDEFTVGRLHPMMDNELRINRLTIEGADPETAVILLDVVLGYGSHPNPAGELAPAIKYVRDQAAKDGRYLEVVTILSGTDADPQDISVQEEKLKEVGAKVFLSSDQAVRYAAKLIQNLSRQDVQSAKLGFSPIDLGSLTTGFSGINLGLESFTESLQSQGAGVIQVDWKPAAGGDSDLMALLEKMKGSGG